jgi:Fur family peroxide stress response transcriptional regulator
MNKKDTIILKLKQKGVKVTPQRIAIINYLENVQSHPTAEDIYLKVVKDYPTISLATIYNTMEKLEEIDEVIKLKISKDNIVNYEYKNEPHHHFYCKKCNKIFDVNVECKISNSKNINGHKVEEVHGYFKGICVNCLKKQSK